MPAKRLKGTDPPLGLATLKGFGCIAFLLVTNKMYLMLTVFTSCDRSSVEQIVTRCLESVV